MIKINEREEVGSLSLEQDLAKRNKEVREKVRRSWNCGGGSVERS